MAAPDARETPHKYLAVREFGSINSQPSRTALEQNEFAWIENLMPIEDANAAAVPAPGAPIALLDGSSRTLVAPANPGFEFWQGNTATVSAATAGVGPGAHRYWRVGDFQLQGGATFLEVSELAWRNSGTVNVVPNCIPVNDIVYSHVDTTNNQCGTEDENYTAACLTLSSAFVSGFTVSYDFHTPTPTDLFRVGHKDTSIRFPVSLVTYYSDDGTTWTAWRTFGSLIVPANGGYIDLDMVN